MPVFPILLLLFLAVPVAEIYVLIKVGSALGAPMTIGLVILTAVVGAALMRTEGMATIARVQQEMRTGQLPATGIIEGALLLFSGALLLTPGFLTDAFGFILVFRPTRMAIARTIASRAVMQMHVPGSAHQPRRQGDIDGEYSHEQPRPTDPASQLDRDR